MYVNLYFQAFHELRESLDIIELQKDTAFPSGQVPECKEVFRKVGSSLVTLTYRVLTSLALALGQEKEFFGSCHRGLLAGGNCSKLRSLHYPPIEGDEIIGKCTIFVSNKLINCR